MTENTKNTDELVEYISLVIRAFLVAGRKGAPAEGLLPFNPLNFQLLRSISRNQKIRPSELADELAVPRTTISTAIKGLQKRDLIMTTPDDLDGRALVLTLTEDGKKVAEAILRQDRKNANAMLFALDENERDSFVNALGKIALEINKDSNDGT